MWFTALLLGALALFSSAGTAHAQAACPQAKAGTKYKVKIESAPPGATVYLGGKECGAVGVTPWSGTLAAGDTTVLVELDGYNPESKPLKVARSRTGTSLFVPLIKKNDPPKIKRSPCFFLFILCNVQLRPANLTRSSCTFGGLPKRARLSRSKHNNMFVRMTFACV